MGSKSFIWWVGKIESPATIADNGDATVGSMTITMDSLRAIYPTLNDNQLIVARNAHVMLLQVGLFRRAEMAIVLDRHTGAELLIIPGDISSIRRFVIPDYITGEVIVVHNHPNNSTFSASDILSFTIYSLRNVGRAVIDYLSTQGHNGNVYSISIGDGERPTMSTFVDIRDTIRNYFSHSRAAKPPESFDVINCYLCEKFGWNYRRGVD